MALCRYHKVVLTFTSNDTYRTSYYDGKLAKKIKKPIFNR